MVSPLAFHRRDTDTRPAWLLDGPAEILEERNDRRGRAHEEGSQGRDERAAPPHRRVVVASTARWRVHGGGDEQVGRAARSAQKATPEMRLWSAEVPGKPFGVRLSSDPCLGDD